MSAHAKVSAGLTKMVSRLGKEGAWRKALEIYQNLGQTGIFPDTAITNAAISACDKGKPALHDPLLLANVELNICAWQLPCSMTRRHSDLVSCVSCTCQVFRVKVQHSAFISARAPVHLIL